MKIAKHKLVRDHIPEIIEKRGAVVQVRTLDDDAEYLVELGLKLIEEAK